MASHDATPGTPQCSHVSTCELFPIFGLSGSLGVWKTFYCTGNFEACARYQAALAGRTVQPNLLPNGKSLDLKGLGT